jgi:signal transduction histidine kinase
LLQFHLRQQVILPLEQIRRAALALGEGNYSQRVDLNAGKEIQEVVEALNRLAQALEDQRS